MLCVLSQSDPIRDYTQQRGKKLCWIEHLGTWRVQRSELPQLREKGIADAIAPLELIRLCHFGLTDTAGNYCASER
jgi:hypothetical protein